MGEWPNCPNGHGPLEPEEDVEFTTDPPEKTKRLSHFYCPDCEYEYHE